MRVLGIDLIRLISFLAIIFYHTSFVLWGPLNIDTMPAPGLAAHFVEVYARTLSFSGFSILLISFFLFGFKPELSRKWRYLWGLLFFFFVVWSLTSGEFPDIWDIYPFLLVAVLTVVLVRRLPSWFLILAGVTVTSLPFWKLEGRLPVPLPVEAALIGICRFGDHLGEEWPLLPWLGYPIFALGLGRLAYVHRERLTAMPRMEVLLWAALCGLALPYLGSYYYTPIGNRFACFAYRQPLATFWAHQFMILMLMRFSFLDRVQSALNRSRAVRAISRLQINRRFFLAYFLHFPILEAWGALARGREALPGQAALVGGVLLALFVIETIPIVIARLFRDNRAGGIS